MIAGRLMSFAFVILTGIAVFVRISMAKKGSLPELRRIAGFDAIEEAVGRATELGRPILFTPGKGDIADITGPQLLAGMDLLSHVSELAARNDTDLVAAIPTATVQPIAEDIIRTAFSKEGKSEKYSQDMVRFVSPEQMAYAVATAGIILREKVAATFLVGPFFGESLIIAESASQLGAIQIAGTSRMVQIPLFVGSCDYTLIGEEMFAASAYLTRDPAQLGVIAGQDLVRAVALALIAAGSVFSTVGINFLNVMMKREGVHGMRREVPLAVGMVVGFLFVIEYFFKAPALTAAAKSVQSWVVVVSAFMMGLGATNLLRIHSKKIVQKKKNWISSVLLIVSMVVMFASGALFGQNNVVFKGLFKHLYEPLGATAFATLIFYTATVIFRSFRLRDSYTIFFMLSAAVVMFGRSPLGETLVPSSFQFADWIFKVPNLAGQRGILIGSAIGAVTVGLRVILGMERKYLGE